MTIDVDIPNWLAQIIVFIWLTITISIILLCVPIFWCINKFVKLVSPDL